jgi:hypothetical protein
MLKTVFRICAVLCFSCVAVFVNAQSSQIASVGPPMLTFVVDGTNGLRPVIGVPGSASIASSLNLGFDVLRASVPPGNDYILAMTSESNWPRLLQFHGGTITVQPTDVFNKSQRQQSPCDWPIDSPFPQRRQPAECVVEPTEANTGNRIDRIALSPKGSAAAFFSESEGRIYAFSDLSRSPTLLGRFEVSQLGPLSALGISDDGRTVLAGTSDGNSGSLFVLTLHQSARMVSPMRHPSAVAFLHGIDVAVIADDVENKIYTYSNGQVFTLAAPEHGISSPIGIAVSKDNNKVFVANAQSQSITIIGVNGVSELRNCNCALTGLHPTKTDSVFRLTDFSGGPVLLFDASGATPRWIFVPISGSQE